MECEVYLQLGLRQPSPRRVLESHKPEYCFDEHISATPDGENYLARPQLIYDGLCNLCTTAVRVLHVLDQRQQIQYVPYQELSASFRHQYGLTNTILQGQMHMITQNGRLISGAPVFRDVCRLMFPFCSICMMFVTPEFRRLYDWIARHRYWIFGCRGACYDVDKVTI